MATYGIRISDSSNKSLNSSTTGAQTTTIYTVPSGSYARIEGGRLSCSVTGASSASTNVIELVRMGGNLTSTYISVPLGSGSSSGTVSVSDVGAAPSTVFELVAGDVVRVRTTSATGPATRSTVADVAIVEFSS